MKDGPLLSWAILPAQDTATQGLAGSAQRWTTPSGRVKKRGIGLKIITLFVTYLVLAAFANVAWRLLHFPPQMQHGVLDPGLMLLSGVILLACILAASVFTLRLFEDRPLSSVGIPLSSPWLRETCIGLLVGSCSARPFLSGGLETRQCAGFPRPARSPSRFYANSSCARLHSVAGPA